MEEEDGTKHKLFDIFQNSALTFCYKLSI